MTCNNLQKPGKRIEKANRPVQADDSKWDCGRNPGLTLTSSKIATGQPGKSNKTSSQKVRQHLGTIGEDDTQTYTDLIWLQVVLNDTE